MPLRCPHSSVWCGRWTAHCPGSLVPDFCLPVWILCEGWWCKWSVWWQEQRKQKIIFQYWLVLAMFSDNQFFLIHWWISLVRVFLKLGFIPGLLTWKLRFSCCNTIEFIYKCWWILDFRNLRFTHSRSLFSMLPFARLPFLSVFLVPPHLHPLAFSFRESLIFTHTKKNFAREVSYSNLQIKFHHDFKPVAKCDLLTIWDNCKYGFRHQGHPQESIVIWLSQKTLKVMFWIAAFLCLCSEKSVCFSFLDSWL